MSGDTEMTDPAKEDCKDLKTPSPPAKAEAKQPTETSSNKRQKTAKDADRAKQDMDIAFDAFQAKKSEWVAAELLSNELMPRAAAEFKAAAAAQLSAQQGTKRKATADLPREVVEVDDDDEDESKSETGDNKEADVKTNHKYSALQEKVRAELKKQSENTKYKPDYSGDNRRASDVESNTDCDLDLKSSESKAAFANPRKPCLKVDKAQSKEEKRPPVQLLGEEDAYDPDTEPCAACGGPIDPDEKKDIACDCCFAAFHLNCVKNPPAKVGKEDWFCDNKACTEASRVPTPELIAHRFMNVTRVQKFKENGLAEATVLRSNCLLCDTTDFVQIANVNCNPPFNLMDLKSSLTGEKVTFATRDQIIRISCRPWNARDALRELTDATDCKIAPNDIPMQSVMRIRDPETRASILRRIVRDLHRTCFLHWTQLSAEKHTMKDDLFLNWIQFQRAREVDDDDEEEEVKDGEDATMRPVDEDDPSHEPTLLSEYDTPLVRDSFHHSNRRIFKKHVAPWCHRFSPELLRMIELFQSHLEWTESGVANKRDVDGSIELSAQKVPDSDDESVVKEVVRNSEDYILAVVCRIKHANTALTFLKKKSEKEAASLIEDGLPTKKQEVIMAPVEAAALTVEVAQRLNNAHRLRALQRSYLRIAMTLMKRLSLEYDVYDSSLMGTGRTNILSLLTGRPESQCTEIFRQLFKDQSFDDSISNPSGMDGKPIACVLASGYQMFSRGMIESRLDEFPSLATLGLCFARKSEPKGFCDENLRPEAAKMIKSVCAKLNAAYADGPYIDAKWLVPADLGKTDKAMLGRITATLNNLKELSTMVRSTFDMLETEPSVACTKQAVAALLGYSKQITRPPIDLLKDDSKAAVENLIEYPLPTVYLEHMKAQEAADAKRAEAERDMNADMEVDEDDLVCKDVHENFVDSFELFTPDAAADALSPRAKEAASKEREQRRAKRARMREACLDVDDSDAGDGDEESDDSEESDAATDMDEDRDYKQDSDDEDDDEEDDDSTERVAAVDSDGDAEMADA